VQLFFSEFRKYKFKEQLKTISQCTVPKKQACKNKRPIKVCEGVSDCCLTPTQQFFNFINDQRGE
jgi:hypothetical protein